MDKENPLNSEFSLEQKIPASIERTLRKGNINFDFLQPEEYEKLESDSEASNRRTNIRQGKRGLFNRGRPPRPFQKKHLYFAIFMAVLEVIGIVLIALSSKFIWILVLPVLLTLLLGTLIMVTLLLVRPL